MFEILRELSDGELLRATHWLGLRLNARTPYSDASHHRIIADEYLVEGAADARVWEAVAHVLEEIEAVEGRPIHLLTDAQVDPHFHRMIAIQRERRKPSGPEARERALRTLEEMRRDYGDVGRRKIA